MNEALRTVLKRNSVERVSDILVAPVGSGIRYAIETPKLFVRSFGANFNLLIEPHLRQLTSEGVKGVYSVGNGLAHDRDMTVVLVQIIVDETDIPQVLGRVLEKEQLPYDYAPNVIFGKRHHCYSIIDS